MTRTMSATEARVHFGELLRDVNENGQTVFVERGGQTKAVVLSLDEYRRLGGQASVPEWQRLRDEVHAMIRAEGGGPLIPPPEEIIRAMRDEIDLDLS